MPRGVSARHLLCNPINRRFRPTPLSFAFSAISRFPNPTNRDFRNPTGRRFSRPFGSSGRYRLPQIDLREAVFFPFEDFKQTPSARGLQANAFRFESADVCEHLRASASVCKRLRVSAGVCECLRASASVCKRWAPHKIVRRPCNRFLNAMKIAYSL